MARLSWPLLLPEEYFWSLFPPFYKPNSLLCNMYWLCFFYLYLWDLCVSFEPGQSAYVHEKVSIGVIQIFFQTEYQCQSQCQSVGLYSASLVSRTGVALLMCHCCCLQSFNQPEQKQFGRSDSSSDCHDRLSRVLCRHDLRVAWNQVLSSDKTVLLVLHRDARPGMIHFRRRQTNEYACRRQCEWT